MERKQSILHGGSNSPIQADPYVTLIIEFDKISIKTDFVEVPGSLMNTSAVIGTNSLNGEGICAD